MQQRFAARLDYFSFIDGLLALIVIAYRRFLLANTFLFLRRQTSPQSTCSEITLLLPTVSLLLTENVRDRSTLAPLVIIIDADATDDVWRPATPHSSYAKNREDTILRPFKLIPSTFPRIPLGIVSNTWILTLITPEGGHHYEENGLANFEDEPEEIKKIHKEIIAFVKEWLKEPVEKFNETA